MGHAEETRRRWQDAEWVERVFDRWAGFFGSLLGEPEKAKTLCELGMKLVRQEGTPGAADANNRWTAFFCCLVGKPQQARALCELGMKILSQDGEPGPAFRADVEAIVCRRAAGPGGQSIRFFTL
jgi:hypothetical protein